MAGERRAECTRIRDEEAGITASGEAGHARAGWISLRHVLHCTLDARELVKTPSSAVGQNLGFR